MQEIVFISQFAQHVEVYRRREEGTAPWSYVFYGPGAVVELISIDVRLPIASICRGIDFDEPLLGE